jgi:hypothetical protein
LDSKQTHKHKQTKNTKEQRNKKTQGQTHKKEKKEKKERKKKKEKKRKKKRRPTGLIEELKKEKKRRLPWRNEQTPVASLLCASLFFRFVGASLRLGIADSAWAAHAAQDLGARRGVRRDLLRD